MSEQSTRKPGNAVRRLCRHSGIMLTTLCLLAPSLASGQEPDASLQQCRSLQQKIERLDDQRKRGGSASQMDRWKRQRQVVKDQFNALRCRHWGNQLR